MRPRLIVAIALIALVPALASCGGSNTAGPVDTSPSPIATVPETVGYWNADLLSVSIREKYAADLAENPLYSYIKITQVGCVHVEGNTWECLIETDPISETTNLNVTVDDVSGTWISRPLNP